MDDVDIMVNYPKEIEAPNGISLFKFKAKFGLGHILFCHRGGPVQLKCGILRKDNYLGWTNMVDCRPIDTTMLLLLRLEKPLAKHYYMIERTPFFFFGVCVDKIR